MAWRCYQLTYELRSPLHIGYNKVGNLQRTRYYLPARNLWGALTERLTRCGFASGGMPAGNYQKIGRWVQEHCAFTYFYILENDGLLQPRYSDEGLCYGPLTTADFERRYLDSLVTTALSPQSTSAETGSLHEVEFISPYPLDGGAVWDRTRLQGWIFVDDGACALWPQIRQALEGLSIGGERRYGFGRLRLVGDPTEGQSCGYEVDRDRPRLRLNSGDPLPAHTPVDNVPARGLVEPLVGRETRSSARFGGQLINAQICWVPGSVLGADACLDIQPSGVWKAV